MRLSLGTCHRMTSECFPGTTPIALSILSTPRNSASFRYISKSILRPHGTPRSEILIRSVVSLTDSNTFPDILDIQIINLLLWHRSHSFVLNIFSSIYRKYCYCILRSVLTNLFISYSGTINDLIASEQDRA